MSKKITKALDYTLKVICIGLFWTLYIGLACWI